MKLTLGFSPCPNDTFIFYGMIHNLIESPHTYAVEMLDVAELNKNAFESKLDITKLSFNAYGHMSDKYQILDSGSALGRGCGPLLISRDIVPDDEISSRKIYIPGKYTTANFLLSFAHPNATKKTELLFSEIENRLLKEPRAMGLIIHENRFTYQDKGLNKNMDLGEYWESKTGHPIPLGCIAIGRELSISTKGEVQQDIYNSIQYAYDHESEVLSYCKEYAQEMNDDVMKAHISLYVNEYSRSLGISGRQAIIRLYKEMERMKICGKVNNDIFHKIS